MPLFNRKKEGIKCGKQWKKRLCFDYISESITRKEVEQLMQELQKAMVSL